MAGRFSVEAVFKAVDRVTAPVSRMQQRVGKFTRGTERGLRRINRAISATVSGFKRMTGAAIKYGTIGLGAVAGAAGLLIREFSKIENAEAAFTPLLGGAKRAKEMVNALNETAATTPFQFETLAGSANQLLPVMNGNINETIRIMRMLGDTAGGNAQKLDSITRGFTKAMLKGKVDMESLNMIAEAGVPVFQDLAEVMGMKTGPRFFKMISKGKVTTAQLTEAFEKLTGENGKFFKGMEISSKTTSGLWSTLKDNISLTAAGLGSVLAPTIKDIIRQATAVAQRVREWVKNNRELINTKFLEFIDTAKQFLLGLVDAFNYLRENGPTILKFIAGLTAMALALKAVAVATAAVNLVMRANPIGLLIAAFVAAAALIYTHWEPIKGFFATLWDGIVGTFNAAISRITSVVDRVKKAAASITGTISDIGGGVAEFFGFDEERADVDRRGRPRVVSPQDRTARMIEERRSTSSAEVTIKDETGRAQVTRGELGPGLDLQLTGAM